MSSYNLTHCLGFNLIKMFVCHSRAGLSGSCGNEFIAISVRGMECIKTFISMCSAIQDQSQMPFILL
jgi:hypothetical protein